MFNVESPHPLLEQEHLSALERRELLEGYVTRGRALVLEGDRGLIDSHRRRALNLGQFFTPARVVETLTQAMGLMDHPAWEGAWQLPERGSVVDCAGCGNGRMFQFLPADWGKAGADVDPLATRAARLIYPEAEILDSDLLEFRGQKGKRFTAAMINPPFSLQLTAQTPLGMRCAQWGVWGKGTSAPSHLAALEIALGMAELVGAILPTSAMVGDDGKAIRNLLAEQHGREAMLRLDLPTEAFRDEGTEWPCSILLCGSWRGEAKRYTCETWEEVDEALSEWISLQRGLQGGWDGSILGNLKRGPSATGSLTSWRVPARETKLRQVREGLGSEGPLVRLCLGGRGHRIVMKPNGLIAGLAIEEARLWQGWMTSDGFEPQSRLDWACDLVRNAGAATSRIQEVVDSLESLGGLSVSVDQQLWAHARMADRRAHVEMTSFSQWVKVGDGWEERGRDMSGRNHPAFHMIKARHQLFRGRAEALPSGLCVKGWDRAARVHAVRKYSGFPIYAFSRKDIGRALSCRSVIYSAKQGLAKTRFSIGAVLASGASKALWVLESRLVNEFKRELGKIGMLDHFHRIETAEDLKNLKLFNVVTYSRIWKPVNDGAERRRGSWGPGKSFAAALAKRRMMVVLDEAHKIKAATSKQGIACRLLCQRAKRVVMLTGTAVQSYARNILGLVNAGWGDGSAMNPYGYRRPVEGGYYVDSGRSRRRRNDMIRGVTSFVDQFVDVLWYTPAFEQTASTGMKSREIPRLKDVPLWDSYVRPKIIRRVPGEPEVRASGVTTPESKPEFIGVDPDTHHFAHYKLVMDRFATIWKERLERERETGKSENNAAHILPELDALRFASTAPVAEHRWAKEDPRLRYASKAPTAVMLEALRRIAAWVEAGDRVVVGAEKPAALQWLADLLADLPRYVPDSEPVSCMLALDADIDKRNSAIDRARDDGEASVLLISVGKGKEGLNLPEFAKLLTLDYGWVHGDLDQFRHRILRPGQTGDVEIVHLHHVGMIDAYMQQLCMAKTDAIAQAIDGQETQFDYSQWKDYRTFALEMLEQEGYKFAAEALARERSAYAA